MRKIVWLFVCIIFLMGCTSVPRVSRYFPEGEGQYRISLNRDYRQDEEMMRYAINSFVMDRGGTSYDLEKHPFFNDFVVTIPGNTMVIENLPVKRLFHVGRTLGIAIPATVISFLIISILR